MTKTLKQVQAEYEAQFPGFIARSQVAEATRRAQLAGVRFTPYNAQRGL
jgi:hypothetical protein